MGTEATPTRLTRTIGGRTFTGPAPVRTDSEGRGFYAEADIRTFEREIAAALIADGLPDHPEPYALGILWGAANVGRIDRLAKLFDVPIPLAKAWMRGEQSIPREKLDYLVKLATTALEGSGS